MRFCILFLVLLLGLGLAGCWERSVLPPAEPPPILPINTPDTSALVDPHTVLDRMLTAYRTATSYWDQATIQIIGTLSQPDAQPISWNCAVAFQKPNRLWLSIGGGTFVSDGEHCVAQIRSLPNQFLHFPAPEQWTLETLFRDVHLDAAMELSLLPRSVLRFPPQLVLLFANNPLNTFCPRGAKIEWLEQRQIGRIQCDVIQISHSDGNRLLWISRENNALLRLDYQPVGLPVPKDFESIEAIRIEMTDARFDWNWDIEMPTLPLDGSINVSEFQSGTPGLPTAEEHRRRLKLMADSDTYRLIDQHFELATPPVSLPLPQETPRIFTLAQVWSQPLAGVSTMALLPGETSSGKTPKLLIPCEGNVVAVLDLEGNLLQRVSPESLDDSIIMNIQAIRFSSGKQRIGIITLDGKFHLFDESFTPLGWHDAETNDAPQNEPPKGEVRAFRFIQHHEEELLVLAMLHVSAPDDAEAKGIIDAFDLHTLHTQGTKRWTCPVVGIPNQIASAVVDNQMHLFVSCTASQDSILILSPDGTASEPMEIAFGRNILWFQPLDTSTLYALWENIETGDIRFVGLNRQGQSQWSRLLPSGEHEVEPVYLSNKKQWLVPSPKGQFSLFDLVGNILDTFTMSIIPTGLICVETAGASLLILADGETISAWTIEK